MGVNPFRRNARRNFRLTVDGEVLDHFRTYEAAMAAVPEYERRWSVDERVGGRYFNLAFGYKSHTTSTADLAAMGVPIHPSCVSDGKL